MSARHAFLWFPLVVLACADALRADRERLGSAASLGPGGLTLQLEDRTGLVTIDDVTPGSPTAPRDPLNPAPAGGGKIDVLDADGNVIGGLWPGFSGEGYLDMGGDVGDALEFDVTAQVAGPHDLAFRFANGSSQHRPMAVSVDGAPRTLDFPPTGAWSTWQVAALDLDLPVGTSRIRLENLVANGPNLDEVVLAPPPTVEVELEDRTGLVTIDDVTPSRPTAPRDPLDPTSAGPGRIDVLDADGNVIGGLWPGFSGEGYLDMGGDVGDAVEAAVSVPATGRHTVVLRFANGSSIHRPMDVSVSGGAISRLDFPPTGGWSVWEEVALDVDAAVGARAVRLENTVNNGPNLDRLSLVPFFDADGDALSDLAETRSWGTDPTLADTDGDTVPDGIEIANGTDPNDPSDGPSDPRPNIVLILADDLGWSDIGAFGSEIATPALDSLADQGLRFTTFTNTAKCFPTRSALLTGVYAQQTGTDSSANSSISNAVTLGEVLRSAGYRTLMSGKHHGLDNPYDRGFDHSYGLRDGAVNYFNPGLQRPGEPDPARKRDNRKWMIDGAVFDARDPAWQAEFPAGFYATDAFTDEALDHLDTYGNDPAPFFLYLAYTAPHDPLHAPAADIARYQGVYDAGYETIRDARYDRQIADGLITASRFPKSAPTHRDWSALSAAERADEARRMEVYAAMVDRMDQNIGRIIAKLQQLGQLDDTIVLFASDNGASDEVVEIGSDPVGTVGRWASLGGDWANVANTPFRRFKNSTLNGGIASPLIVHWPAGIVGSGRVVHEPLHIVDVMPTLLELAGGAYPRSFGGEAVMPMQGSSFAPLLRDEPGRVEVPRFYEWRNDRAVIIGWDKAVQRGSGAWQLYRLDQDATETTNLASVDPARRDALAAAWTSWQTWATATPPDAVDDAVVVSAGGAAVVDVLVNDVAAASPLDPASVAIHVTPEHGSVTVATDGTLTYASTAAGPVLDRLAYTVRDVAGAVSHRAWVTFDVQRPRPGGGVKTWVAEGVGRRNSSPHPLGEGGGPRDPTPPAHLEVTRRSDPSPPVLPEGTGAPDRVDRRPRRGPRSPPTAGPRPLGGARSREIGGSEPGGGLDGPRLAAPCPLPEASRGPDLGPRPQLGRGERRDPAPASPRGGRRSPGSGTSGAWPSGARRRAPIRIGEPAIPSARHGQTARRRATLALASSSADAGGPAMSHDRSPLTPYPRGWFHVARTDELPRGGVKSVRYFGRDVVLFRTHDGIAHAVDPYCPHLGAHLGHGGVVEDGAIRCPFHGWAFEGATGRCVRVPGAARVPGVGLSRWPVQEVAGMILVWHHDEGAEPDWHVPDLPREPGRWTPWMESRWTVRACCQDVVENDVDVAHIPAMHGFSQDIPEVTFSSDGPSMRLDSVLRLELAQFGLWGRIEGPLITRKFGLTIGYITFGSTVAGVPIGLRTLGTTTPIDDDHVDLRLLYSVRRSPVRLFDPLIAAAYKRFFDRTVRQDIVIWENKRYRLRPALSDADGPFVEYRRWARQFYSEAEMRDALQRARG